MAAVPKVPSPSMVREYAAYANKLHARGFATQYIEYASDVVTQLGKGRLTN